MLSENGAHAEEVNIWKKEWVQVKNRPLWHSTGELGWQGRKIAQFDRETSIC